MINTTGKKMLLRLIVLLMLAFVTDVVLAERIKDIATIAGVRPNQLVGYGLVVGLDGTGDQTSQTPFTVQSMKTMLNRFGVTLPENLNPQVKNIAAVTIHAELPAFAKPGQTIDVTVSSMGNAKSLRGGSLLMAPLKGADGQTYALAQGNLIVGGFGVGGSDGSKITVNVPSVGRIPNGASVERSAPTSFADHNEIVLNINRPDFTTAKNIADVINTSLGSNTALALDATSVKVIAPASVQQKVQFVSFLENLTLVPGEASAKVIINSRTGTVVIGNRVRVTAAAVAHGNLTVSISERKQVSQPSGPLTGGSTVVVPATDLEVVQEDNRMFKMDAGVSLDEIVRAVNNVGAAPGDLVAILEALREAGALRAELIVI